MKFKNIITTLFMLISINYLSAQHFKSHEFSGRIFIEDKKAKEVTIKVYDGNKCFSTYITRPNAKFIFVAGIEDYYTIEFEKEGYVTKRVVVNTKNTRKIKSTDPFKFDITLEKEEDGVNYSEHDFPAAIIEIDEKTEEFVFNEKYTEEIKRRINLQNQMAKK